MRLVTLAVLTSMAIASPLASANAAWKTYVVKELGFSFMAPGDVKAEIGISRAEVAGPRQTVVFRSSEDKIEYKVTVTSFTQAQADGAILIGEREFLFRGRNDVVMDTFTQLGTGKDTIYGHKVAVGLPMNKGQAMGAFYFTNGKLYTLEATAASGNANALLDQGRFVNSLKFDLSHVEADAVELHPAPFE